MICLMHADILMWQNAVSFDLKLNEFVHIEMLLLLFGLHY